MHIHLRTMISCSFSYTYQVLPCAFRYRRPLEPGLKIAITLHFLVTGNSFQSMEFNWRTEHNTIGKFVFEVSDAIIEEYAREVFRTLTTTDGWLEIAKGFQERWNFPRACGALDGKHVAIWKPKQSDSIYYNYKGFFSIVILVLCDANYKAIWAHVGSPGSESDCGIYNDSPMFQGIQDETIKTLPCSRVYRMKPSSSLHLNHYQMTMRILHTSS